MIISLILYYMSAMTDLTFYALSHKECYEICKRIRAAYHYENNKCTVSVSFNGTFIICDDI